MNILAYIQEPSSINDFLGIGGGMIGLIVFGVLAVNAVLWLFLPWLIISRLDKMCGHLRNIERAVEANERHGRPAGAEGKGSGGKLTIAGLND